MWSISIAPQAFGAAVGFVSWIGLMAIGAIEAFLYMYDLVKGGAEAKDATKEIHNPKS